MAPPSISIHPVLPSDFLPIAKLEVDAFAKEEFDVVAFGPNRFSDAATEGRAKSLAAGPKPGETLRNMKAVVTLPDGTEEIVGFASSNIVVGRAGSEGEKKRLGTKEEWAESAEKGEVKDPFGPDADMKFCHDAIIKGDEHMAASTMGTNYAKLFVLVVSPKYQRQGIGGMLLKDFLNETDKLGLQAILGASEGGLGLYKKNGFEEFEVMKLKLWEYERGQGMGITRHIIMHRPAVTKRI